MELAPQKAEGAPLNLLRTGASSPPLHLFPSGSSSRAPTLAAVELLHRQRPPLLPSPRPLAADLRRRVRSGGCSGCTVVAGPSSTDDPLLLPSRAAAQPPPTWKQGRRRSRRSLLQFNKIQIQQDEVDTLRFIIKGSSSPAGVLLSGCWMRDGRRHDCPMQAAFSWEARESKKSGGREEKGQMDGWAAI
ncbi:hypothetical protein EJB05_21584, partial [Eragrostis curvula]